MKRLLSLLLALVMVLGMTSAASAEKVQVEFWFGLGGATGELIKEVIEEFNGMHAKLSMIFPRKPSRPFRAPSPLKSPRRWRCWNTAR